MAVRTERHQLLSDGCSLTIVNALSSTVTTCPQISSRVWLAPWLPPLVYTLRYWGAWRMNYPLKSWGNHTKIGLSMLATLHGKIDSAAILVGPMLEMKDFTLERGQLCMIWVTVFEQCLRERGGRGL